MEPDLAPTRVRTYVRGPLPGGQLPDHGKLLTDTFAEFGDHIGPYLLAGLGYTLVIIPVTFIAIFGIYVCAGLGSMGTFVATAFVAEVAREALGSDLGGLLPLLAAIVPVGVAFLLVLATVAAIAAVFAPVGASLFRAVADHQRGEGKALDLSAPFSTAIQEPGKAIAVSVVQTVGALLLLPFCLVPVLLVPFFTQFAGTLVALHDVSAREALVASAQHVRTHLLWHAIFLAMVILLGMAAANIPVVGPAFLIALWVRAHRELFGDGIEPVLDVVRA